LLSLAPGGFEHNRGRAYVPFTITDWHGRNTPARFIWVHMTDNLYIIARLTADGPDYRGEIHADPIRDLDTPPKALTEEALRLLQPNFPATRLVDEALAQIGDRSLTAEVRRWQCHEGKIGCIGMERARLERQVYQAGIEQGLSHHRLQEARAI
jgi:hypothetical protein